MTHSRFGCLTNIRRRILQLNPAQSMKRRWAALGRLYTIRGPRFERINYPKSQAFTTQHHHPPTTRTPETIPQTTQLIVRETGLVLPAAAMAAATVVILGNDGTCALGREEAAAATRTLRISGAVSADGDETLARDQRLAVGVRAGDGCRSGDCRGGRSRSVSLMTCFAWCRRAHS